MKELYIIRHGETELNRLGIVQGRGINADLNDTGLAQAKAFYETYNSVKFDKIYTSSLVRTHQTVKGFIDLGLPWEPLTMLDELAWGEWEGKPGDKIAKQAFRDLVAHWQNGNYTAKFKDGESPSEVAERLVQAIEYIKNQPNEKRILVCMHGRALRLLLCLLLEKPLCHMEDFPHQNTSLYRLQFADNRFSILDFNNILHLEPLSVQ